MSGYLPSELPEVISDHDKAAAYYLSQLDAARAAPSSGIAVEQWRPTAFLGVDPLTAFFQARAMPLARRMQLPEGDAMGRALAAGAAATMAGQEAWNRQSDAQADTTAMLRRLGELLAAVMRSRSIGGLNEEEQGHNYRRRDRPQPPAPDAFPAGFF